MADVLLDAFIDSLKMIPFLFVTYLIIEFIEHKSERKFNNYLTKMGKFGSVGGALLGCIPQCGFSVVGASLYSEKIITVGTLVAIFISTSDEAIPILIAMPAYSGMIFKIIGLKIIIAVAAGLLIDAVSNRFSNNNGESTKKPIEDQDVECECGHSILKSAIMHTLNIFIYILILSILLNAAIEFFGATAISKLLMYDTVFQPIIAAVIGFIPNCAASVLLTELFVTGALSFGSLMAGLCTGAGVGLIVLLKSNKNTKNNLMILLYIYVVSVIAGMIIDLF